MNHLEVVSILKELPPQVCLVCARTTVGGGESAVGVVSGAAVAGGALVKAKSDGSLAGAGVGGSSSDSGSVTSGTTGVSGNALVGARLRSRSLEPLTGLAMWSSEPQIIGVNLHNNLFIYMFLLSYFNLIYKI